jgi:hypothetical protein
MNRFAMTFTTIQSSREEREEIGKLERYPVRNTTTHPVKNIQNDKGNVLINPGLPSNNLPTLTNTRKPRANPPTKLIVGNGSMSEFLASGGVGNGCSSCGGAR